MHNALTPMNQQKQPRFWGGKVGAIAAIIFALSAISQSLRAETLLFFAAASTGHAIDRIVELYGAHSDDAVRVSLAASSTLAVQIANGAPADIFLSANIDWMDYLAEKNAIVHRSRVNLLANQLALIAASNNPVYLRIAHGFPLTGALGDGRLSVADPDHVPAGMYAKTALENLGIWQRVRNRLARTANARAAILLIARGEAPLGVAYTSDVVGDGNLRIIDVFPAATHPPIIYPMALIVGNKETAARTFANFLVSGEARRVFDRHGFTMLLDR